MENQTNRSLRNTLVIRNLGEEKNESWKQTQSIVAELINKHLNIPKQNSWNMIERCHRSTATSTDREIEKIRPVCVKFHSWNDAQFVLHGFTKIKIKNKNFSPKIDQMYTKSLTKRRNNALKTRKELINDKSNSIVQGYV